MPDVTKRRILDAALRKGEATLFVKGEAKPLKISWEAGLPLEVSDQGVSGTVYVGGEPVPYFYGWENIWRIIDKDGRGDSW